VLFTIAQDLTKMQVDTSVAEADVGKLRAQMPATFTVDAYPTERFHGTVRQIRNAPTTVQNVVTYDAVIDVNNSDLKLKPGMTANVTFVYAEKKDVLRLPNAAMRFKPPPEMLPPGTLPSGERGARPSGIANTPSVPGARHTRSSAQSDQRQVWVLRNGPLAPPVPVSVKVGVSDGSLSEIVDGDVKEGDEVITDVADASGNASKPGGPRFRGF
jgi:HlyD family secretion protein